MTRLRPVPEWQLSKRVKIEPGSTVRLIGTGGTLGSRLPGRFKVLAVFRKRTRVYLDVRNLETAETRTVFVQGRPYRRFCVRWAPFKVKRVH